MYKKEYEQVFEIKDENWMEKSGYKNLLKDFSKDFSYQADKRKKEEDNTKKEKIKQKKT